jgi:pimeloyl-ACP methyl ester carboxylesterase
MEHRTLSEKSFDTGEVLLNYAEGPDAGPPLVMLHGLTGWWHAWEPLLPQFTSNWHVNAVDLRGHGRSGRAGDHYLLSDYARDIAEFLKQRFVQPAVLMGHSLGALTALATAPLAPDHVRAVILVDPPLSLHNASIAIMPGAAAWFRQVYELVRSKPTLDEVIDQCRLMEPELDTASLLAMAENVYRTAAGTVAAALQDRLLEGMDLGYAAQQIKCPLLLMRGEWSRGAALRDEDADWFQTLAPRAQVVQIRQGGHIFLWGQPEVSFAHIHAFLRDV